MFGYTSVPFTDLLGWLRGTVVERQSLAGELLMACARPVADWRPRHQGGAHGGRAPAKIVRAPAKITGLIMFHLCCQIQISVFWGIFRIKKSKKTMRVFIHDSFSMTHGHFRQISVMPFEKHCIGKHRCSDMARV